MQNQILERMDNILDEVWEANKLLESICQSLVNANSSDDTCECITKTLGSYARKLSSKNWTFLIEKDSYLNTLRMACTEELSLEDALNYFQLEQEKLEEVKEAFNK